MTQKSFSPPQ